MGPVPALSVQSLNQPNGPAALDASGSAGSMLVLGRTLAARAQDRINIKDAPYSAALNGTTDDSAAWAAAINAVNTDMAAGYFPCIYMPAGTSLISATALPTFRGPGCIEGDGPAKSFISVGPSYAGDLFSWSEAWMSGNYPPQSGSTLATTQRANAVFTGISITGNTTASSQQNALVFYDRDDFALVRDVNISTLNGRAVYAGVAKYVSGQGYMRESVFDNVRIFTAGAAGVPAVEFNTVAGSADSTNEIDITNMNIFAPNGPGFVVRGPSGTSLRNFVVHGLRIEGANAPSPAITADLLQIGDPTLTGQVANMLFSGLELINPYTGSCAIETTAPSGATMPYNIKFDGLIGLGPGKGVCVTAGRALAFRLAGIATAGANVTIGPSTLVGTNLLFDGNGAETGWTYSIDPTSTTLALALLRNFGNPSNHAIVPYVGSVIPVAPGANAVDLQMLRSSTAHTASGAAAVVGGGESNKATNTDAVVTGGAQNVASGYRSGVLCGGLNTAAGQYSAACGLGNTALGTGAVALGQFSTDRTTNGKMVYAGGEFAAPGDAQTGWLMMRGSGASASAITGTSDGAAAGAANVGVIPAGTHYHLRVSASCRDGTSAGWAAWDAVSSDLDRAATGAPSYSGGYLTATAPSRSGGTLTGMTLLLAADTVNNGLAVTWTPPAGNTDTVHCLARADTTEELQ
jgi:hypothetical protein